MKKTISAIFVSVITVIQMKKQRSTVDTCLAAKDTLVTKRHRLPLHRLVTDTASSLLTGYHFTALKNMLMAMMLVAVVASCNGEGESIIYNGITVPKLLSLKLHSSEGTFVRTGKITIEFVANKSFSVAEVTLGGVVKKAKGKGRVWEAIFDVNEIPDGHYSSADITITANDFDNNVITDLKMDKTTNSVIIDTTAPTFVSGVFSLLSGTAPIGRGETLVFTATFSETLMFLPANAPQVTITDGLTASPLTFVLQSTENNPVLQYHYQIPANASVATGQLTVEIASNGTTDLAGNVMMVDATDDSNEQFTSPLIDLQHVPAQAITATLVGFADTGNAIVDVSIDASVAGARYNVFTRLNGVSDAVGWNDSSVDISQDDGTMQITLLADHVFTVCVAAGDACQPTDAQTTVDTTITPRTLGALVWYEGRDATGDDEYDSSGTVLNMVKDKSGRGNHLMREAGVGSTQLKTGNHLGEAGLIQLLPLAENTNIAYESVNNLSDTTTDTLEVYSVVRPDNREGDIAFPQYTFHILSDYDELQFLFGPPASVQHQHAMSIRYHGLLDAIQYELNSFPSFTRYEGYIYKSSRQAIYTQNGDYSPDGNSKNVSLTMRGSSSLLYRDAPTETRASTLGKIQLFNKHDSHVTDKYISRGFLITLFAFGRPLSNAESTLMKQYIQREYRALKTDFADYYIDMGVIAIKTDVHTGKTCTAGSNIAGVIVINLTGTSSIVTESTGGSPSVSDKELRPGNCPDAYPAVVSYTVTAAGVNDTILIEFTGGS